MVPSLVTRLCVTSVAVGIVLRMVLVHTFCPPSVGSGAWAALLLAGAAIDSLVAASLGTMPRLAGMLVARQTSSSWLVCYGLAALAVPARRLQAHRLRAGAPSLARAGYERRPDGGRETVADTPPEKNLDAISVFLVARELLTAGRYNVP